MDSYYTGEIYHKNHGNDIHTVAAKYYNPSTKEHFYMDERDLHDYIGVTEGDAQKEYIRVMRDIQNYKQKHGIETSYLPVDEWELIDYSRLEID